VHEPEYGMRDSATPALYATKWRGRFNGQPEGMFCEQRYVSQSVTGRHKLCACNYRMQKGSGVAGGLAEWLPAGMGPGIAWQTRATDETRLNP